jgi:hypothetical protein
VSGSLWSYIKNVFFGRKSDPVAHAEGSGFSSASVIETSTIEFNNTDTTALETSAISQLEPHLNALTALPFYDENLLDCCITQWKFGDWQSLIKITKEQLEHHPEREKLAILIAAGHFQIGAIAVAKEFTQTAMAWGCSQRLVSQILIAGVHNSLGRAAVLSEEPDRALGHFKEAITVGAPKSEATLFVQARAAEQTRQTAAQLIEKINT